jgi:hypothetical protein
MFACMHACSLRIRVSTTVIQQNFAKHDLDSLSVMMMVVVVVVVAVVVVVELNCLLSNDYISRMDRCQI